MSVNSNQKPCLASDIMVARLHKVRPEELVLSAIRLLVQHRISGAPVVDEGDVYQGMFSEKCCMSVLSGVARSSTQRNESSRLQSIRAKELMNSGLVTLAPDTDVFDAIGLLLDHKISGAPVLDEFGDFVGIFSEKGSMNVLIESAYSQLPTSRVGYFMDVDRGRVIDEETDLMTIARLFLETPYRRLVVLRNEKVVGLIGRRDVLACLIRLSEDFWDDNSILNQTGEMTDTLNLQSSQLKRCSPRISEFMDTRAKTITEQHDFLSIAQLFRDLPYRRLPVLRGERLVGQISRRDLLQVVHRAMELKTPGTQNLLYLSSLVSRDAAPVSRLT